MSNQLISEAPENHTPVSAQGVVPRLSPSHFIVSNSMMEAITTCPWKAQQVVINSVRSSEENAAQRFGKCQHLGLSFRYKQTALGVAWTEAEQLALIEQAFASSPLEIEGWRNYDAAQKVMRSYNMHYPIGKDEFKIMRHPQTNEPVVEMTFMCDTKKVIRGRQIWYAGTLDGAREYSEGPFVADFKTTSLLGDSFWVDLECSEQQRGYCWAFRECFGFEPVGYEVIALGCRASVENSYFDDLTGKVLPLRKEGAKGRTSSAVPVEFMDQRFFTKFPSGQLDEWFENMIEQVDNFLYQVDKDKFARHHKHCVHKYGTCEFHKVCTLPQAGRASALQSAAFAVRDDSPTFSKISEQITNKQTINEINQ